MAKLVLVRHGISEWNKLGLWTGWKDVDLTPEGVEEAKGTGEALKDIHFDLAFTSVLKRAQQSLHEILAAIDQEGLQTIADRALNERDYGDLTGKNKWEVQKEYGDEKFLSWRRAWNTCEIHENVFSGTWSKVRKRNMLVRTNNNGRALMSIMIVFFSSRTIIPTHCIDSSEIEAWLLMD